MPAMKDETAHIGTSNTYAHGSRVHAVNATGGIEQWQFRLDNGSASQIVIVDGSIQLIGANIITRYKIAAQVAVIEGFQ